MSEASVRSRLDGRKEAKMAGRQERKVTGVAKNFARSMVGASWKKTRSVRRKKKQGRGGCRKSVDQMCEDRDWGPGEPEAVGRRVEEKKKIGSRLATWEK